MNKILIWALLAFAASVPACVVTTTPTGSYYVDTVSYFVEEPVTVVDSYGYRQFAACSGYVYFTGYVDHSCVPSALEYSRATVGTLTCSYINEDRFEEHQFVDFEFPAGYIQDSCAFAASGALTAGESPAPSATTAAEPMKFDPELQPQFKDGLIHATKLGNLTLVSSKRLGSNVTFDEWLKARPKAFVRKRVTTIPTETAPKQPEAIAPAPVEVTPVAN
jgi:hypothetical protein